MSSFNGGRIKWDDPIPDEYGKNPIDYFNIPIPEIDADKIPTERAFEIISSRIKLQ